MTTPVRAPRKTAGPKPAGNGARPATDVLPHNLQAERSLLGAALLSPSAREIAAAVPVDAYYGPGHQTIAAAIIELTLDGHPVDNVTVADKIGAPLLDKIGGAAVLVDLQNNAPATAPASAERYRDIILEDWQLRRTLYTALELGNAARAGQVDDVAHWRAELLDVGTTTTASSWDEVDLEPVVTGDQLLRPPTMLHRDDGLALIYPGEIHAFNAESESGKAQPHDTPVLTPDGWRPIGDLWPGDYVIGADGHPTRVRSVHERGVRPVYRLTTDDGASTECCDEHLWLARDINHIYRGQPGRVVTALQLRAELLDGRRRYLPMVRPVQHAEKELPVDPYLLGLLLGDGGLTKSITFTTGDPELIDVVETLIPSTCVVHRWPNDPTTISITGSRRGAVNPLLVALRTLDLMGRKSEDKHIPPAYLLGSVEQRLALLQGLLDTDGGWESSSMRFTTSSAELARGVIEIVESLGGVARSRTKTPTYMHLGERRHGLPATSLAIRLPFDLGAPFRLERKAGVWHDRVGVRIRRPQRRVVSIDYIADKPVRCIAVDAADHLYVTERHMVTHNTWLALAAVVEELNTGSHVVYIDNEDSAEGITERLAALGAHLGLLYGPDRLFHYVRPDDPIDATAITRLARLGATLVVIDGVTEAMSMNGFSIKENDDVALFLKMLPRVFARSGAAVILIDHVVKNKQERGDDAIGGQHKRAGIAASYKLETLRPFGRNMGGASRIITTKDRFGHVRAGCAGGRTAGELRLVSSGTTVTLTIAAPSSITDPDATFRPTVLMERISHSIETTNAAGMHPSSNDILKVVSGKRDAKLAALKALVTEGFVEARAGRGNAHHHVSIKPYREADDPSTPIYNTTQRDENEEYEAF